MISYNDDEYKRGASISRVILRYCLIIEPHSRLFQASRVRAVSVEYAFAIIF